MRDMKSILGIIGLLCVVLGILGLLSPLIMICDVGPGKCGLSYVPLVSLGILVLGAVIRKYTSKSGW